MEIPVQVCVRVRPIDNAVEAVVDGADNVVQIKDQSFPFSKYLGPEADQHDVYLQTVAPFLGNFFQGYDLSIVTYGSKNSGKSYTMYGPNVDTMCMISESDFGICHRFVRDIFTYLTNQSERIFYINIGWTEISSDNEVKDLLDNLGLVQCFTLKEALEWIQHGLKNRNPDSSHSILSLILEQQWVVEATGLFQHRLSTISFCDLRSTSAPKDVGLETLEEIINAITDDSVDGRKLNDNSLHINYSKTILTSFLKDSFGGRAQTLFMLCVSPDAACVNETLENLQVAFKAQSISNYVVMNTYTDNNLPFKAIQQQQEQQQQQQQAFMAAEVQNQGTDEPALGAENLQFAAQQWMKLLKNAEGLFQRLAGANEKDLNDDERAQIQEWLLLKAECDDCFNSNELSNMLTKSHSLLPIQEEEDQDQATEQADDDDEIEEEDEDSGGRSGCSDNDSEAESTSFQQLSIMEDKIEQMLGKFQSKTDLLVKLKYLDFLKSHPTSVTESVEKADRPPSVEKPTTGRRKSIQPGHSLSSLELDRLQHVAKLNDSSESIGAPAAAALVPHHSPAKVPSLEHKLNKCTNDIEALQKQIGELEQTTVLKQKLIGDLMKSNDTRNTAKQRFTKKKIKLEADYEKAKKQLGKAVVGGRDRAEIERLELQTSHLEQRLQDLASIKHLAGGTGQKIKQLQASVQEAKKQIQQLHKNLKKERKYKEMLEKEVEKSGGVASKKPLALTSGSSPTADPKVKLRDMTARISHLDHILKEKSENLQKNPLETSTSEKESLRHEIRNLRRTRDHLLDQRCSLDKKLKREKMLSYTEERKLMECDEAIEAIDATIELKNEAICGRRSIDTDESLQREKGEQMLMARLNRLSEDEMRTLLYKYFQKVIDLRDSSRKLEIQLMDMERDKDSLEWREKILTNALRQARLEGERSLIVQQRQHETKLNLMLRHFASETSVSSSFSDKLVPLGAVGGTYSSSDLDMYAPPPVTAHRTAGNLNLLQLKAIKAGDKHVAQHVTHRQFEKVHHKEKDHHETKNKLFAKFQVLTKYQGTTSTSDGGERRGKHMPEISLIPEQSLKQLHATKAGGQGAGAVAKVTRQKNKIIIQQNSGSGN